MSDTAADRVVGADKSATRDRICRLLSIQNAVQNAELPNPFWEMINPVFLKVVAERFDMDDCSEFEKCPDWASMGTHALMEQINEDKRGLHCLRLDPRIDKEVIRQECVQTLSELYELLKNESQMARQQFERESVANRNTIRQLHEKIKTKNEAFSRLFVEHETLKRKYSEARKGENERIAAFEEPRENQEAQKGKEQIPALTLEIPG